jgi:hypothetical protein
LVGWVGLPDEEDEDDERADTMMSVLVFGQGMPAETRRGKRSQLKRRPSVA